MFVCMSLIGCIRSTYTFQTYVSSIKIFDHKINFYFSMNFFDNEKCYSISLHISTKKSILFLLLSGGLDGKVFPSCFIWIQNKEKTFNKKHSQFQKFWKKLTLYKFDLIFLKLCLKNILQSIKKFIDVKVNTKQNG